MYPSSLGEAPDGSFGHGGPVPPSEVARRKTGRPDRAAGAILGMACGDALGAGYEFGPPLSDDATVAMLGGGSFRWQPGEWTDDTSMAVPILRAVAEGKDLLDEATQDEIVAAWVDWARTAPDVGIQTRAVLSGIEPTAAAARASAKRVHDATGKSAGNGSLMRTAPVALAYVGDRNSDRVVQAARAISDLTHYEEDAGDACVIWTVAVWHAVMNGSFMIGNGVFELPEERRARWYALIEEAECGEPRDFAKNGWVVQALQGAWSAISRAGVRSGEVGATPGQLRDALERAVRGGRDTDTVAAIAGALVGAMAGASAVPAEWLRIVHGWPGLRAGDLSRLAERGLAGGELGDQGWPTAPNMAYAGYGDITQLARHPRDPGVWIGGVGVLDSLPEGVDAVVSLCRVGTSQIPASVREHLEFRLIDSDDPAKNEHLRFVLREAADAVAALRADGRTVYLHCVQGISRTPTVAALYSVRHFGADPGTALAEVGRALPMTQPKDRLLAEYRKVAVLDA